jgi:hypothetical protein
MILFIGYKFILNNICLFSVLLCDSVASQGN